MEHQEVEEDSPELNEETPTRPQEGHQREFEKEELVFGIEDTPPWYLCIFLGFQHYLTSFGATIGNPLLVTPAMCITDDVTRSEVIGTIFAVSGLVTLIQTTIGIRLPVIQGGTFTFAVPILAILSLPKWRCPAPTAPGGSFPELNMTNFTLNSTIEPPLTHDEIWQPRMREVQGAIIVASLFQILVGMTGIIGFMLRYIGPLVIAPTVCLTGLSLFDVATQKCQVHWGVASFTILLLIIFSQYMRNVDLPIFYVNRKRECKRTGYPVFKLFPVILAILLSWAFCAILTAAGAFAEGHGARTDLRINTIRDAKWFNIPYPGQWGMPTVSAAGVFGMLSGVLAGMFESIGDYYACARIAGAPPPPIHAVNRGITIEGIGCVISGLFGTGSGTTTYSENVGAIGITKVASRRVIQSGAILMIIFGMFGKFGALFVTIPDPVIGGVFMIMFGVIAAVGVSNLQFADLNSTRNLFVFGFSLFLGLAVPVWLKGWLKEGNSLQTGNGSLDQIITVLLSTSMFVGGLTAFILDNTVPGTKNERGMVEWLAHLKNDSSQQDDCYNLPRIIRRVTSPKWTSYIPVCPSFKGYPDLVPCKRSQSKYEVNSPEDAEGATRQPLRANARNGNEDVTNLGDVTKGTTSV